MDPRRALLVLLGAFHRMLRSCLHSVIKGFSRQITSVENLGKKSWISFLHWTIETDHLFIFIKYLDSWFVRLLVLFTFKKFRSRDDRIFCSFTVTEKKKLRLAFFNSHFWSQIICATSEKIDVVRFNTASIVLQFRHSCAFIIIIIV